MYLLSFIVYTPPSRPVHESNMEAVAVRYGDKPQPRNVSQVEKDTWKDAIDGMGWRDRGGGR